jgi:transcriptional regulator with XRE-family HTH domain
MRTELKRRQLKNPGYSLRAMARDIGISPSSLSSILKEKQKLSPQISAKIMTHLAGARGSKRISHAVRILEHFEELCLDEDRMLRLFGFLSHCLASMNRDLLGDLPGPSPKESYGLSLSVEKILSNDEIESKSS